jgi:hypothetical protein
MKTKTGIYHAEVIGANLEMIGKDTEYPVLKVNFRPYELLQGSVFVAGEFTTTNVLHFLGSKVLEKGRFAGKTQIEALREELKDTYGYTGDLTKEALEALNGVKVEINVKPNGEYFNVAFVNKIGGRSPKVGKPIPEEALRKLNQAFKGAKDEAVSAKGFFDSLPGAK